MRGDRPHVAERIGERAHAIAIELVGNGTPLRGASGERTRERRIDVVDVEHQARACATERLRTDVAFSRILIGEHHVRITDLHFGVRDALIGLEAHQFDSAKCLAVERKRTNRIAHHQVWRDAVVTVRNCRDHETPPWMTKERHTMATRAATVAPIELPAAAANQPYADTLDRK